jgi:membrane protein implicated in regulation of membrane protease activity
VLATVFGVSLGLCGVTFVLSSGGGRGGGFLIGLGILELVALGVSMAGLLLTLLVFVTLSLFRGFSEKVSQSEGFPEEEDDTKIDKNE